MGTGGHLVALGLRDVPWAYYDLQGLGDHRNTAGSSPMTSPSTVNSRLPGFASTRIFHPGLLRPGEGDPFFVQVVRVGQDRGGELEYLQYSHVFYNHGVEEPILGILALGTASRVRTRFWRNTARASSGSSGMARVASPTELRVADRPRLQCQAFHNLTFRRW